MLKIVLKTRYITVVLLVLSVMFISLSSSICKSDGYCFDTYTARGELSFSADDFVETFFFCTKINHPDESFFVQAKNKQQSVRGARRIESMQAAFKIPYIDDVKELFPLYGIICIFIVLMIIKYIYNTDGKKRISLFYNSTGRHPAEMQK